MQPDQLIGQTIGNYLVKQKLGEGGMGSVYLAEHPSIGKKVALKVLHSEFSSNSEVIGRFFTEAKAVNDIGHPNIVDIVDYGVLQIAGIKEQLVYFFMEYLAGNTLSQLIRAESPLPPERALSIAMQVADALAASHKCNIVHRDLKPDNIILLQRGRERDFVKLLDFGIAKLTSTDKDGGSQHRTRTGIVMGTPAYMSPEQCEGRGSVDHRTDIYALGIVLYEMLTGRVPFIGEGYGEILVQHLTQTPLPPSQYRMLPPHVELVVMKALEKRSELRYPSMDEFMRGMSDPVGYVESQGGMTGFLQRQLMPSTAPLPAMRMTPPPMTGMTPIPGSVNYNHYTTPPPTTMGQASGQVTPARSKMPFIAIGLLVVVGAAIGIVVVVSKSKATTTNAGTGSDLAAVGSDKVVTPITPIEPKGSDEGSAKTVPAVGSGSNLAVGSGSNVAQPGTGSGSAAVEPTTITLTVETTPPGATILINGFPQAQRTNTTITLPINKGGKAPMLLKLKGFADVPVELDLGTSTTISREFKKKVVPLPVPGTGKGSSTGKGSNTGKGGTDGDGLMRPGD
ncbi:MAG: serine/threonine protein kinase [Deltaproteobacteria bacterium]|nr:serine/threonine protein kinase [Deltaproteobacteria bacterium]